MKTITLEIDDEVYSLLEVLTKGNLAPTSVADVIGRLIDHAQRGVYRPGAWERPWLEQCFGDEWVEAQGEMFALPRHRRRRGRRP